MAEISAPSDRGSSRAPLVLLILLIVLAAILRIFATRNDLWLDEIISLGIVDQLKSPWQIFSAVHSDNNHYLNTLYMYSVRGQNYAPIYRYLSVVFGVAVIPAGYWLLARRSQVDAVIFAVLLTCSYPLIHFSSEARGYSGALLGSVLACGALVRWMESREAAKSSFWYGAAYGLAVALAVLSHLTACLIWFYRLSGTLLLRLAPFDRARRTTDDSGARPWKIAGADTGLAGEGCRHGACCASAIGCLDRVAVGGIAKIR
jgi:uncharacterized membrane protein